MKTYALFLLCALSAVMGMAQVPIPVFPGTWNQTPIQSPAQTKPTPKPVAKQEFPAPHLQDYGLLIPLNPVQPKQSVEFTKPGGQPVFTLQATNLDKPGIEDATLSFDQKGSGRIDRLSDNEYSRLQKLRQAVADAENEIAVAHGITAPRWCADVDPNLGLQGGNCELMTWGSYYRYQGQFLILSVPPPVPEAKR